MPWGNGDHIWATTLLCHKLPGPWPIHLLPFYLNRCRRNYLCMRCIDVAVHYEMTFLFSQRLSGAALKEMCHCSLDNKVALCTKTNPLRPFYPPEDTFTQWETGGNEERERERHRPTGEDWERERERERNLCSSMSVYCVWMWCYKDALFPNTLLVIWPSDLGLCSNRCTCVCWCACVCIYIYLCIKGIMKGRAQSNNKYPVL